MQRHRLKKNFFLFKNCFKKNDLKLCTMFCVIKYLSHIKKKNIILQKNTRKIICNDLWFKNYDPLRLNLKKFLIESLCIPLFVVLSLCLKKYFNIMSNAVNTAFLY